MQKEGSEFALQGAIIQSAPSQAARVAPPSSFPRNYTQPQAPIALNCVCKRLYFQLVSSVAQLCLTLCDPMDFSMPGFFFHHQLLELAQTHAIESVMPSNHLIHCCPLLLLPSIFPSIRVFSKESVLCIR